MNFNIKEYLNSSYLARARTSTFFDYLCNEKKPLLIASAIFIMSYLILIFAIDIHYFYSRMTGDALNYYLKGLYLLHNGSGAARYAENIAPFKYIAMPGYLRIPFLLISDDFAVQLRLIQLGNIFILSIVCLFFSYLLTIIIPPTWKHLAIPIIFASLFLSNNWQLNVIVPFSDSLFTLFFCFSVIAIRSTDNFTLNNKNAIRFGFIIIFALLATSTKFNGLLLIIYALLCWIPFISKKSLHKLSLAGIATCLLALAFCVIFRDTIFWYIAAWLSRFASTKPLDWILNIINIALPAQIVPNYQYFYTNGLTSHYLNFNWNASGRDEIIAGVGFVISVFIGIGMWCNRRLLLPEIAIISMLLPVIAPITTSTSRYLHPFQAILIGFFISGIKHCYPNVSFKKAKFAKITVPVMATLLVLLTFLRVSGAARSSYTTTTFFNNTIYNVSSTYQQLDSFLSTLSISKSRLLFISNSGDAGKWQAIRGLRYMAPDDHLKDLTKQYNVYAVFDHDLKKNRQFAKTESEALKSLSQSGRFKAELVFDSSNQSAWGRVYRITAID